MPWPKSATTPSSVAPFSVPCAEAVRLAALEASWRRDKRVARRRLFWRWTLWYIQRYHRHALALMALVLAMAYFSGARWPAANGLPQTPPVLNTTPLNAGVPPQAPLVEAEPPAQSGATAETDGPVTLRPALQLAETSATPDSVPIAAGPPDTLPLKPETWLHSKEP